MDSRCLEHCLTEEECRQFDGQGYLMVEDALDAGDLDRVTRAVDALYERHRVKDATAAAGMGSGPPGLFSQTDFIREDDAFLELVDWHRVFPKIWGILGWNIYLYHAHCDVTPPVPVAAGAEDSRQRSYRAWHQDSMRVNEEIEIHPRPRLSVKVAYFLTDTTVPGCGNMWVYPGSQRMDELHVPDGAVDPPGAVPVVGKPGTAIIYVRHRAEGRLLRILLPLAAAQGRHERPTALHAARPHPPADPRRRPVRRRPLRPAGRRRAAPRLAAGARPSRLRRHDPA
jgi:hypothetical protein